MTLTERIHDIELVAADAYRTEQYGVQLVSVARYPMMGKGLHNRHHDHTVEVWENRPSKRTGADPVQLVDPHGRPTTDTHTVLMSAKAIVITAHPAMRDQQPVGDTLCIGQLVRLTVNGYPLGTYRIEAGVLSDPVLVSA